MTDFLISEAIDEDQGDIEEEENHEGNITFSDEEFIDDSPIEQSQSDYYGFINVSRDYDDAIRDSFVDLDESQETNNFVNHEIDDNDYDDENKIDNFKNFESKVEEFKKSLIFPHGLKNSDSLFYALLYRLRHHLNKKIDAVDDEQIKKDISSEIFDEISPLKKFLELCLDIFHFENQCNVINRILNKHNLFLRIFELKEKFCYITKTSSQKKNIVREISSCVIEKFNGFHVVRIDFEQKLRKDFLPIDIVYKPIKKEDEIIDCFFTGKIYLAYRTTYNNDQKTGKIRHGYAFRCHYCSYYFTRLDRYQKHLDNCVGKPGFVYKFDTDNLSTFEDNLKFKRDIPLTAYIDFETAAPTDNMFDPEACRMNAISYAIIFAFHPNLDIKRVIIERSFGHSLEKLASIDYLTGEQLKYVDAITLKQLRDCALEVADRKNCHAISQMFSIELKFAADCLLKWFYAKNKKKNFHFKKKENMK